MSVTNFALPMSSGTPGAIEPSCGESMQGLGALAPAGTAPAGSFGSLLDAGTPVVSATADASLGEAQAQTLIPLCGVPVMLQPRLQPVDITDLSVEVDSPAATPIIVKTEDAVTPEPAAQVQQGVPTQPEAPASGLFTASPVASNRLVPRKPVNVSLPLPAGNVAVTEAPTTSIQGSQVQTGELAAGSTEEAPDTAVAEVPATIQPSIGFMEQSAVYGSATLQTCQNQITGTPESMDDTEGEAGAASVTGLTAREKTTGSLTSEGDKIFKGQGFAGAKSQGRLHGQAYGVAQSPAYASALTATPLTEDPLTPAATTPAWSAGYVQTAKEFSTLQAPLQNTKVPSAPAAGSSDPVTADTKEPGITPIQTTNNQAEEEPAQWGNQRENQLNGVKGDTVSMPASLKDKDSAKTATLAFDATDRTSTQPGAGNVKVTQATDKEVTTEGVKPDGIRNAKSSGNMSINRRNNPEKASAESTQELASGFATVRTPTIEASAPVQRTQVTEAAQRTLAIVTEVSEKMQAKDSKRVDFDVKLPSDQRVSVNLEYKNGLLHVSFKTDSTALRDALSQEWTQTMVTADSAVRFAEPSFGGNAQQQHSKGETFDMSGGRQGQQQTRSQQQEESRGTFSLPISKSTAKDGVSTRETLSSRRAQVPETTRLLNVIA